MDISCVGKKINILIALFTAKIKERLKEGDYFIVGNCMYSYLGEGYWNRLYLLNKEKDETIYRRQNS
ncbi:MAG TPA: hypothetical protein VMZ91_13120 [Candidatus Paceibacterota bacterium]|nr:hypothetical protein [Candidatus Paceibacterota bacterium]